MGKFIHKLAVIVEVALCLLILAVICSSFSKNEIEFSNWILGKWRGEIQSIENPGIRSTEAIQVDFIDREHLIFISSLWFNSGDGEPYGMPFQYQFASENSIALQGRGRDNWSISREGDQLMINSGLLFGNQRVLLNRVFPTEKLASLLLGIFMINVLALRIQGISLQSNNKIEVSGGRNVNIGLRLVSLISYHILAIIVGSVIAVIALSYIIGLKSFFFSTMPWRSIIFVEVAFSVLAMGIKMMRANLWYWKTSEYPSNTWIYYLGIVLTCIGLLGLLAGIVMWTSFMVTVRAYLGKWYLY